MTPEEMILDIFVRLFPGVTFVDVNQAHRMIVQDIKFQQEIRSQLVKQKNTYRVTVFFTVNRHWEPEKKIWDQQETYTVAATTPAQAEKIARRRCEKLTASHSRASSYSGTILPVKSNKAAPPACITKIQYGVKMNMNRPVINNSLKSAMEAVERQRRKKTFPEEKPLSLSTIEAMAHIQTGDILLDFLENITY